MQNQNTHFVLFANSLTMKKVFVMCFYLLLLKNFVIIIISIKYYADLKTCTLKANHAYYDLPLTTAKSI